MELLNFLPRKYLDEHSLSEKDSPFQRASQKGMKQRTCFGYAFRSYVASVGTHDQRER